MKTKLNFGCGLKIKKDFLNVDMQRGDGIDKSFDFDKYPYPLNDNSFTYVEAVYILEHLNDVIKTVDELWRICKDKAIIKIVVPYYHSHAAYQSINHKHYFSEASMHYLFNIDESNPFLHDRKNKFKLVRWQLNTGKFWRWLPNNQWIRAAIGKYIPNVIDEMIFEMEVVKLEKG